MSNKGAVAIYDFEEIDGELGRPPFAALRALQAVGVLVTPKGWLQLSSGARRTLTEEGARERIDMMVVRTVANGIPANQIKLVSRTVDPNTTEVPTELLKALGPQRAIPLDEWHNLAPLDRFVLSSLAYNTRLLWRAIDEMERKKLLSRRRGAWTGAVARCEIHMRSDVLAQMMGADFLDGRALVLARGAGRRAARRASETFDLQSETEAGPIELDWGVLDKPGGMLWQAHVSGWDGAFLPAASLQAALTAATAIYDMIKELDPRASISFATVAEEPWLVGNDGPADLATRLFAKPAKSGLAKGSAPASQVVPNQGAPAAPPAPPAPVAPTFGPHETLRLESAPIPGRGVATLTRTTPPPPGEQRPPPAPGRHHSTPPPPPAPGHRNSTPPPPSSGRRGSTPPPPMAAHATPVPPSSVAAPPAPSPSQSKGKPAMRMEVPGAIQPPTPAPGTADETLQLDQFRSDNRPVIAALLVIGLVGAGLLGYVVGK